MLEFVVAFGAHKVVAPNVFGSSTVGTRVEQRDSVLASSDNHPTKANLCICQACRLVSVAIGVVRLNPRCEFRRAYGVLPISNLVEIGCASFQNVTNSAAVVACAHAEILSVFFLFDVAVLQDFTIDEEAIFIGKGKPFDRFSAHSNIPKVVLLRFCIERVGGQSDMFCCVVAEAVCATSNKVVNVKHEIVLEIRIFRIYVRKSADTAGCAIPTVVIVFNRVQSVGMVQIFATTHGFNEIFGNGGSVEAGMIRQYVDEHLYAILLCFGAHSNKFITSTELIVADFPIAWLIVVIPLSVAKDLHTAIFANETCVGRRGLNIGVTRSGNVFHIFFDGVKRPAPSMEDGCIVGNTRFAALFLCLYCKCK